MPAISLLKNVDGIMSERNADKTQHPAAKWKLAYGHVPVKRSINFVTVGEKPIDWKVAVPAIILIVFLAGFISKVAVIDRLAALNAAYEEVYQLQEQINAQTDRYNNLPDISEDYAHYTVSNMTAEERNRISRVTVMNVVQKIILPVAPLDSWELSENKLSIHISNNTLTEITAMMDSIREDSSVLDCLMQSESTTVSTKDNISTEETITAEVDIYFKTTEQLQKEAEEAKAKEEAEREAAKLQEEREERDAAAKNADLRDAAAKAAAIDDALDAAGAGIGDAVDTAGAGLGGVVDAAGAGLGGAAARAAAGIQSAVSEATGVQEGTRVTDVPE